MFSLAMAETEYADGVPVLGWENRLMNDPHVVALIYQIEHGHAVDYGEAKSMDHEEPDFSREDCE